MTEAELQPEEHGAAPAGPGWFIVNVQDAAWRESPHFGSFANFEGEVRFSGLGVNVHVLQPGQAACKYHSESEEEAFLVLSGECLLLVDEEERPMRTWDFFHCPPGTKHVFVGAGDGPCAILMIGRRSPEAQVEYPTSELADRHGAGVPETTPDPRVAYAGLRDMKRVPAPWPPATS